MAIAILSSAVLGVACRSEPPTPSATEELAVESEPFPEAPDAEDTEEARTPLPDDAQIYQDDSGLFALALPQGYSHEAIANGMTFRSADEGFGGTIAYEVIDTGEPLSSDELEAKLRQDIESQFSEIKWQSDSQPQPDGSLRLDWQGKTSKGATLDALSFIEQHGPVIYTFSVHGIDKPYDDYNDDAQIIAGTYVVQENPPESISSGP